jgi:predicted alpha/beta superfamily hydrolase
MLRFRSKAAPPWSWAAGIRFFHPTFSTGRAARAAVGFLIAAGLLLGSARADEPLADADAAPFAEAPRIVSPEDNAAWLETLPNADALRGLAPQEVAPRGGQRVRSGIVRYYGGPALPTLEILQSNGGYARVPFVREGDGLMPGESRWLAVVNDVIPDADWNFRIDLGGGVYDTPYYGPHYFTALTKLWLRGQQIYNYAPPAAVSPPQIIKIPSFQGSEATRALYIYLPRGYAENPSKLYPVIYFHDGQNAFLAYSGDAGGYTLEAEQMATLLITQGRLRECVIVGVANRGFQQRFVDYMPHYASYQGMPGRGHLVAAYYINEVAPFILSNYRISPLRENTATLGSSMGGVFSTYIGWEFADFAEHHAGFSPAYWIMRDGSGRMEIVERLRTQTPRDIRLYMDSGTTNGGNTFVPADDGLTQTIAARDAMVQNGYIEGVNLLLYVAIGAGHSEFFWKLRLDRPLLFLLPISQEPIPSESGQTGWMAR